jgi:hypothetical protein
LPGCREKPRGGLKKLNKDGWFHYSARFLRQLEHHVIIPARAIPDAETRLHTIIRNHLRIITAGATAKSTWRGNPVTIVIDETGGLTPAQRRKIDRRKRAYVELLREKLRQLRRDEKLHVLDETVAVCSLLGTMLWVARWYNPLGRLNAEQIAEEILNLAVGGLLQQPSAAAKRPARHMALSTNSSGQR